MRVAHYHSLSDFQPCAKTGQLATTQCQLLCRRASPLAHHTVVLPFTRPSVPCHEGFRTRNKLYPECDLVFHREGAAIVDFRKAWAAACTKAEVKWLRFHDLRRSAVRNMDRAGIPRATIRRIIGHETDAMFDRYRIVDQRDVDEAGAKAEQYLNDQPKSRPNPKDEST